MNCIIKQQNEIDAEKWNEFVYSNTMGWAYFLYELIGMHRYSSYKNISFAIVDHDNNDEILLIHQLHFSNKRSAKKAFLIKERKLVSQWGYVLKDNLPKKPLRKVKECYEQYIDNYINKHKIKNFDISFPALTQARIEDKSFVNPCIFFNFSPTLRYTYVVDLSKPDDRMLADCDETTRKMIRIIEAENKYEIVEAQSNKKDCQTYIQLHKETYTRTNRKADIIADPYNEHIFYTLLPKGIAKVFFLKNKDTSEIVSSYAILIYKNTAYYWWGGSKNEKENGINKYLLFKIICIIRESFGKTGYFETGGAYPYLRNGKYKGLNDFKKCFGTYLAPIFGGDYTKIRSKWILLIKKILQRY